jgi:ketosteroid isomerase-like protein
MSEESIELVRAIHEAFSRGESPGALGLLHPEVEYVNPPGAVEPGTRRGIAEFEVAMRAAEDVFEDIHIEVREMKSVGEHVVVLASYSARGRTSGVLRENEEGYVWTLRDGMAVSFRWFGTPAQALEEVGLASAPSAQPPPGSPPRAQPPPGSPPSAKPPPGSLGRDRDRDP